LTEELSDKQHLLLREVKQILLFLAFLCTVNSIQAKPKQEIRAVWLTTNHALDWPKHPVGTMEDIEEQKRELDELLDRVQEANINLVFFQVRLRGDVIYPSKIESFSPYIQSDYGAYNYDPLHYAVEECHARGIECHAWMVVYPLGQEKGNNSRRLSAFLIEKGAIKSFNGELYLDPGNPETTPYLIRIIKEIVSSYDIDGIHFDYIRYPEKAERFPDNDTYKKFGNGKNKSDWRRENINRFVYAAYDTVKSLKPWVQVSSSVVGMYNHIPGNTSRHWTAYGSVFQDPANWLEKGKHDFIVPMMYYSGNLFFPFVKDWVKRSNGRFIVPGLGLYQMDKKESDWQPEVLTEQIQYTRDNQAQGNVFFRARYFTENRKGIYGKVTAGFYSNPALLPPLTWLNDSLPETPQSLSAVKNEAVLHLEWDKSPGKVFYNVYRSDTFPIDTNNPDNLLVARLRNHQYELPVDDSFESGYYYVVTGYDRYHNESPSSQPVYFVTGNFLK
jgi:uncharacterized lipoprotein YddW (UPF0748 family)